MKITLSIEKCQGPFFTFALGQRLPRRGSSRKQILSNLLTDLAIAGIITAAWLTIDIKAYLLIQMPVMFLGGAGIIAGVAVPPSERTPACKYSRGYSSAPY